MGTARVPAGSARLAAGRRSSPAALQPARLRAGQVGIAGAQRSSPGAQNPFHGGNSSIFISLFPALAKLLLLGVLLDTDTQMHRQMERRTGRLEEEEEKREEPEDRDGDAKMAFLRCKRGKGARSPHSWDSVFSLCLSRACRVSAKLCRPLMLR